MPKNERGWWCPKTFPTIAAFCDLPHDEQNRVIAANKAGFDQAVDLVQVSNRQAGEPHHQ